MRQVVVLVPVRFRGFDSIIHPKYNNMLVDKKRKALKICTTLGNSCSDKETGAMAKLLIIIGIQIPVLLLYLQIRLVLNSIE
jgi:hypothetical protein